MPAQVQDLLKTVEAKRPDEALRCCGHDSRCAPRRLRNFRSGELRADPVADRETFADLDERAPRIDDRPTSPARSD